MKIPIEISARHIHLSQADLEKLFGKKVQLKKFKKLSQPGEFATEETVQLVTRLGSLKLRVLGPVRQQTQVELSATDCRQLGIEAPLRLSGDLKKTAGAQLVGPVGMVKIKQGIIIAQRHIHLDDKTASKLSLKQGQAVSIKTIGQRGLIFDNVIVRLNPKFKLAMHIDTDEANAAGIIKKIKGELLI